MGIGGKEVSIGLRLKGVSDIICVSYQNYANQKTIRRCLSSLLRLALANEVVQLHQQQSHGPRSQLEVVRRLISLCLVSRLPMDPGLLPATFLTPINCLCSTN